MPERDDKAFLAALAGLLHDVGKFGQRAGDEVKSEWSDGKTKADFGYQHALHSWHFANKYLPEAIRDRVRMLAAYHHRPQGEGVAIQLADHLSAGERRKDDVQDDSDRESHPKQLHPVFITLKADGKNHPNRGQDKFYFPLQPLRLEQKVLFASQDPIPGKQVWDDYKALWEAFCAEAGQLKPVYEKNGDWENYLEAMQALFSRYSWCVPAAYFNAVPDISLYDHSRMTAALAACLVDFPEDKLRQIAQSAKTDETDVALLVGGDISGVQDFIYTITNKGATSALRGRSFYLQLLTEAAARFVLRELGLPYTNLIYGGGGNFYLLARATDAKELPAIRQKLSRVLYKHHQGDLYVAIEGIPLKAKDFMRPASSKHPLSDKWGELARAVAVVKNRRFAELDADELKILFKPQGHGGNDEKQCQVCGCEHPDTRLIKKDKDDEGVRKCPACLSYEKLGEDLRKAQFIGWNFLAHPEKVADLTGKEISSGYEEALKDLGFEIKIGETFDKVQTFSRVWALNDDAFEKAKDQAGGKVLVRRLLVNVTPIISREEILQLQGKVDDLPDIDAKDPVKPFGAMAYQSQGITRLGVFRADVDNLGKLFAEGLGNDATLSRIASLSFSISLFFEGWVGEIAKRFNEDRRKKDEARKAEALQKGKSEKDVPLYGDALYAIYSGGDDLFFVGSWDELVEFAWQVNEDLHKYTGGHSGIHISGGMVLVTEKYPLAKAAKDAEKAESAAKNLTWWDENGQPHKKNVFSFLGQPLPWSEFANARELKGRLGALDDNKRTAVIRKLLMNYDLYAEAEKKRREKGKDKKQDGKPQTLYGPWNWRILYLLRRAFGKETPENRDSKEQRLTRDFRVLPGEEKEPDYARLEWVGVAARWMELKDRKRD